VVVVVKNFLTTSTLSTVHRNTKDFFIEKIILMPLEDLKAGAKEYYSSYSKYENR
jgi:hypothetical protein